MYVKIKYSVEAILFLLFLNVWMIMSIIDSKYTYILAFCLFVWVFYYFDYKLFKIKYVKDNWNIVIVKSVWKEYTLKEYEIESIEYLWKISYFTWYWIKYNFFTWEILFTTWFENIVRIIMKDWRRILISPRNVDLFVKK